jgi:hypothetical protein
MITDVDKPRNPTSSEEENITVNCNYHEMNWGSLKQEGHQS